MRFSDAVRGSVSRLTVRAGTLVTALAAVVLLALPAAANAKCHAGVHKFGSSQARTFCGQARATVSRPGKKKVTLQGGSIKVDDPPWKSTGKGADGAAGRSSG